MTIHKGPWGDLSPDRGADNLVPPHEPPHDGGMEARIARLESTSDHILRELVEMKTDVRELRTDAKIDFRILFGALIFTALGLAGLMAHGFHWL